MSDEKAPKTSQSIELAPTATFSKPPSVNSSTTHVYPNSDDLKTEKPQHNAPGHGESALPDDKEGEAVENIEDDWECDPENARNWPAAKKWRTVAIVSAYTFVSPLASSMMAPGIPEIAIRYGITNSTIIALTLCIFLLSFAIAPLLLAPLSEMYGRTWVLHIGNLFTVGFSLGCAFAPNTGALIAFRFLSGFSGSAPIACGGGSVGDLFAAKDRASAMALYSLGPLIGPIVGPVAGGFIAQSLGMKWVFIVIAIACGFVSLVGIPLLTETYGPVIRLRRAKKQGLLEEGVKTHPHLEVSHGDKMKILWDNLARPVTMLSKSLICFMLSLYMAVMYGIFYLMFATFAQFFASTYGFKAGVGGLAYLGLGVGFLIATITGAKLGDAIYQNLTAKNGGVGTPEMRIPGLFFGSFFVPIGLFWYGWSADKALHWIMPIIGSGIFGFGMMTTFLPIQLYLVDSFEFAASAVAASALFRSLLGFAFPLFGKQMFDALGLGPGNSLLGGIAIVLGIPFPVLLWYKGAALRARNPLTANRAS
ncbi:multidrug resistance protein 4 [Ephemerocybe angulata]|uniref:Multidrug resistance protein 4 n=1 Tax=Ephemerocybe angulata TaxID=980116 RepID=A0A8H6IEQ3_9AGAR|nr:multidrug resistance protein 4 [Tulosesus angulatus]